MEAFQIIRVVYRASARHITPDWKTTGFVQWLAPRVVADIRQKPQQWIIPSAKWRRKEIWKIQRLFKSSCGESAADGSPLISLGIINLDPTLNVTSHARSRYWFDRSHAYVLISPFTHGGTATTKEAGCAGAITLGAIPSRLPNDSLRNSNAPKSSKERLLHLCKGRDRRTLQTHFGTPT